jgi:hypothetical protein
VRPADRLILRVYTQALEECEGNAQAACTTTAERVGLSRVDVWECLYRTGRARALRSAA